MLEILKGTVKTIFEDFDTGEPVIKEKAIAFLLETNNKEEVIIVYDKNAVKMGLIKVGEPLTCFGLYDGDIVAKDSTGITNGKRFLCNGIMGKIDVCDEEQFKEQLNKMGAVSLEEYKKRRHEDIL